MHTRKKNIDEIITIDPVALNLFQLFNPNEIRTYSLLNKSTAQITAKFIKMNSVKKSIAVTQKSKSSLINDAKKIQGYISGIKDPVERAALQQKLKNIEEGKIDKETMESLKNIDWEYRSRAQEVCESIGDFTGSIGKDFFNAHMKEKDNISKEDIIILLFFYGISGMSYAANFAIGFVNDYFAKPLKQQFQARLRFLSQHVDENDDKAEENNQNQLRQ